MPSQWSNIREERKESLCCFTVWGYTVHPSGEAIVAWTEDHSLEAQREQEIRLGYKTTRHTVRGPLPPARPHLLHVLQLSQTVLVAKVHVFKHRSLLETFYIQTATVSQRFWMNTSSFKFLLPFFLCSSLSSFPLIFEFQKTQEFFFLYFFCVYMHVHACVYVCAHVCHSTWVKGRG